MPSALAIMIVNDDVLSFYLLLSNVVFSDGHTANKLRQAIHRK
jgi:hypothetical protein